MRRGIACVTSSEDSAELHIRDTMESGAGLCRERVVREVVQDGPARVAELVALGVKFTERKNGSQQEPDLGKEAGHSKRRVLHAGDITGRELEKALLAAVRASPQIRVREDIVAIDLVTTKKMKMKGPNRVVGLYVLDCATQRVVAISAKVVVLATGVVESVICIRPIQGLRRGRRGDGLSGRCGDCEYGVCPVPPHLSFSSVGTKLSDIGSSAGRGWVSGKCQR